MTPREQRLICCADKDYDLAKQFYKFVNEGWTIVQISPTNFGVTYILIHKY